MTVKILGALIVILGCGGSGFMVALSHKREASALQQLICAIDYMQCELQYRLTPLPELCKMTAGITKGPVKNFFEYLSSELEQQISPNVQTCVDAALFRCKSMPQLTSSILRDLGKTLGSFDIDGQLRSLAATREITELKINKHTENQDDRIRSYQTLGICAGAAIAILFI